MTSLILVALALGTSTVAQASPSAAEPAPNAPVLAAAMLDNALAAHRQGRVRPESVPKRRRAKAAANARRPLPLVRVASANRTAMREPDGGYYLGSVQVYPWSEGSLYRLYAAPEQISDIALEAGETLVSVAAGDTARWIIGDTSSGTGLARRTHVLVKPAVAGLHTNLVIATDRRTYHVEAVSTGSTAMAVISWTYPQEALVVVRAPALPSDPVIAPALTVEALNFNYRIDGASVAWRPTRVFDDGHQTFIEFPSNLGDGEAPPLFVIGTDGKAELVNYRVKGHYYVVDRLFTAAELRLGGKRQQVVRIVRHDGGRRSGRAA